MADMHRHGTEEVTCREFVELVTDYWEGALPEDRVELVEEHLVMCDWCKIYLDQMEATVEAMAEVARERAGAGRDRRTRCLSAFRDVERSCADSRARLQVPAAGRRRPVQRPPLADCREEPRPGEWVEARA